MISKAEIKRIHALRAKKQRDESGLFVVEGEKLVAEALASGFEIDNVYRIEDIGREAMERITMLSSPSPALAVVRIPCAPSLADIDALVASRPLCLALDSVRDPGNLGTIVRIADWFGIDTIFCSPDTADAYNPKVVQATMGSIARVQIIYINLAELIDSLPAGTPVYGTLLNGENIYRQPLQPRGLIVMGNEGKGISPDIARRVSHRLLIPNYPEGRATADSLNVAIATAITCAEFRRQQLSL